LYDIAMEAEAERKSGRDFSGDIPGQAVPLEWEALTSFQRDAVDHAVDKLHLEKGDSWVMPKDQRKKMRADLLQDPMKLQDIIDQYREFAQLQHETRRGRG
jgi:hypothetical protein